MADSNIDVEQLCDNILKGVMHLINNRLPTPKHWHPQIDIQLPPTEPTLSSTPEKPHSQDALMQQLGKQETQVKKVC